MVMILPFKEMLKGNVRTYMNGKVARQKKEVWLRVHALLFPIPLSPSYEEKAVWDKQRSRILKSDVRKEAKETKECFRFETKTKSLELLSSTGADPGSFLGGGALVSCSTSTPINHIVFFGRIPVVLENRRSSQGWGGGCAPPAPSP